MVDIFVVISCPKFLFQQETYKVKVDGGQVFVWYKSDLSINPFP